MHTDDELDELLSRIPPMTAQEQAQILHGYLVLMLPPMDGAKNERIATPEPLILRRTPRQEHI